MRGVQKRGLRGQGCGVSQGHGGAGVFELAGQHSSVQLVKLHQVDQVRELCGTVVEAEEHLTIFFTRKDLEVLDLLMVT